MGLIVAEQATAQTLTDRALARLRNIASGNGLQAKDVQVIDSKESLVSFNGEMSVAILCETETFVYPGNVRGKDRKIVKSIAGLGAAVEKHKSDFKEKSDWLDLVGKDIMDHESQGWGLDKAKVTLPSKSAVYAATETCPSCDGRQLLTCEQCLGKGEVICTQCHGQGRETCYYCYGSGEDPQRQGQLCPTCGGTKLAACRYCQTKGQLPCPTCGGKRGTPCKACQSTGKISQEVSVTCGAETHFKMITDGLPSGFRRGLDRIGMANIWKGHGEVSVHPAKKDEEKKEHDGAPVPLLTYVAAVPYAELRVVLGKKKADISVVGKRCAITGVPYFLDAPLASWMEKLRTASVGQAAIEGALGVRAIKDALKICVSGKGSVQELRRLYPFGLSSGVMQNMMQWMKLALNKVTLKTRAAVACSGVVASFAVFYLRFKSGVLSQVPYDAYKSAALDIVMLSAALGVCWATLNFAVRFVLKRRFPQAAFSLQQKIGKTGLSMIAGIVIAFVLAVAFSPIKPAWLVSVFMALR